MNITRQIHSDGKKRRSFVALRFAAGDLRRYTPKRKAMHINIVKVRVAILLLLLIVSSFWLFVSYFPISLNSVLFKRLIISSAPTYIMLYITLLLHLYNYVDEKYFSITVSKPVQHGWNIAIKTIINNSSKKKICLKRVESQYFKTINYNNEFEVDKQSVLGKDLKLTMRDEYVNSSFILRKKSIKCIFFIEKQGSNKFVRIEKVVQNPFRV